MTQERFTVGVALDGAGWHPAAGDGGTAPSSQAWRDGVGALELAGADYVTFEDTFSGWAPSWRPDRAVGRLDATVVAASLAGRTRTIGLVPTLSVTHTEPYHLATRLATLDFASHGRAGWQVRVSAEPDDAALGDLRERRRIAGVPRPDDPEVVEAFDEAAAVVRTARLLWDSWEDGAEIRDATSGRFLDGARLHHVDVETPWFSVAGPSIVPRSPSGQPLVLALAHATTAYRLAVRAADVVVVTPGTAGSLPQILTEIAALAVAERTLADPIRVVADLQVSVGDDARARWERLEATSTSSSDADVVVGTVEEVADRVAVLREQGADGVRLRPADTAADVAVIAAELLPVLARRGLLSAPPDPAGGLRARFGLSRPTSRFAAEPAEVAR